MGLAITLPLNDVNAFRDRRIEDTFETLYREGATTGRLLVLAPAPWLIGQPFRIGSLDAALGRILHRQGMGRHRRRDHRLVPVAPNIETLPGTIVTLVVPHQRWGFSAPSAYSRRQPVQHFAQEGRADRPRAPRDLAGGPPVGTAWGPRRSVASKHPTR